MKVLSLWEPWATLMVLRLKRIETRSWNTTHRGPFLIHASDRWKKDQISIADSYPFRSVLKDHREQMIGRIGHIVGMACLDRVVTTTAYLSGYPAERAAGVATEHELAFGDYTPGRYAYMTSNATVIMPPIRAKGCLRFWDFDEPAWVTDIADMMCKASQEDSLF